MKEELAEWNRRCMVITNDNNATLNEKNVKLRALYDEVFA